MIQLSALSAVIFRSLGANAETCSGILSRVFDHAELRLEETDFLARILDSMVSFFKAHRLTPASYSRIA